MLSGNHYFNFTNIAVLGTCFFIYETTRIRPDYIPVTQKTITYLERLLIIVFLLCIAFALLLTILVFNFIYELLEQNAIEIQPTQNYSRNTNSVQVGSQLDAIHSVPDTPSLSPTNISAQNNPPKSRDIRQPEHERAEHVEHELEEPIRSLPRLEHVPTERVKHELKERIRSLVAFALKGRKKGSEEYEDMELTLEMRIRSLLEYALHFKENDSSVRGKQRRAVSNSPNNEEEKWYDIAPTEVAVERMPIAQRETHTGCFDTVEQHEDNRRTR